MRSNLSELITGANESLGTEYKRWMDTSDPLNRAKLARHIAALANHGGGYLVFGVEDKSRQPQGKAEFDLGTFNQDTISGIIKRYLEPKFQVLVEVVEVGDAHYPVVIVPSHGSRPIIAVADGPTGKSGPQGISQGTIYIRSAGPESVAIRNADDWSGLLERCLTHRADLLGAILRQSIARQARPNERAEELLRWAVAQTATDYRTQIEALADAVPESNREAVLRARGANSTIGYALLDADGQPLELVDLRELNRRVDIGMHQNASYGWTAFLPMDHQEGAPQFGMSEYNGEEFRYLEGRRLKGGSTWLSVLDYWRIYKAGMAIYVQSYWTDQMGRFDPSAPYLTPRWILTSLHSVLAHARLVGQELVETNQVLVRLDFSGLAGRVLKSDEIPVPSGARLTHDRLTTTIALPWSIVRDDYPEALRRVATPVFENFGDGFLRMQEILSLQGLKSIFAFDSRMRLFDGK